MIGLVYVIRAMDRSGWRAHTRGMDELKDLRRRLERAEGRREDAAYQGREWYAATIAVEELRSSCRKRASLVEIRRQAVLSLMS